MNLLRTTSPYARTCLLLLFVSVLFFFSYPTVDNDLWGHLLFGKETIDNGWPAPENFYSYTAPGHAWINHEWLAEVLFYAIYAALGSPGLILAKLLLAGAAIALLGSIMRRRGVFPLIRTFALIWTMLMLWPGFNVRPQLFTYLLFATLIYIFHRSEAGSRAALWFVPPIIAIWGNLHGGVVAGFCALGLFALWSVVRDPRGSLRVVIPSAAALLCLLLNPYGLELVRFLWADVQLVRPITEWEPIPLFSLAFFELKLAFLLVLFVAIRTDAWRRWDTLLALLTGLLAFRHMRHAPLFAIAAAPVLADACRWLLGAGEEKPAPRMRRVVVAAMAGVILLQLVWLGSLHLENRFRLVVPPQDYPTRAADFMIRNGVRGNIAAPFDWGEYLIWKLYPDSRVAMDGRYTTAYPMAVIEENFAWMKGGEGWRELLDNYPTDIALSGRRHPVTRLLEQDPEWVMIYFDETAALFIKDSPTQADLLDRFRAGSLEPPAPPAIHFPG